MDHKKVQTGTYPELDIAANPLVFSKPLGGNFDWLATSYGRALATSGTSLWDHTQQSTSLSTIVAPNQQITVPFTEASRPPGLFDAIVLLTASGVRYLYGFSNSSDNNWAPSLANTTVPTKLFWTPLLTFGFGNSFGDSNSGQPFAFGGMPGQVSSTKDWVVNFLEPLSEDLVITMTFKKYNLVGGLQPGQLVWTLNATAGATNYAVRSGVDLDNSYYLVTNYHLYDAAGWINLTVAVDKPGYTSLLNVYHLAVHAAQQQVP